MDYLIFFGGIVLALYCWMLMRENNADRRRIRQAVKRLQKFSHEWDVLFADAREANEKDVASYIERMKAMKAEVYQMDVPGCCNLAYEYLILSMYYAIEAMKDYQIGCGNKLTKSKLELAIIGMHEYQSRINRINI